MEEPKEGAREELFFFPLLMCSKQTLSAFFFLCISLIPPPPSLIALFFPTVSEVSTAAGHSVVDFLSPFLCAREYMCVCVLGLIRGAELHTGPGIWS